MSAPEPNSPSPSSVEQTVTGDRNQTIGHMSGGTAIANVDTLNQITQHLPRSPESARYSLPLDAADFTGRDDEIQQIEADLNAGRVVAIAGMAGVGKSALAVRVAHRLQAQFPDGQIYLNLRGADSQPLTVESALESLLRALGVDPTQIPVERVDKVALYRSRLAQTQTLVLLDNAADARQVEELLPGTGACLITSRRQLDGLAGVKHLNLEALPQEKALELLQKGLPSERVQAEEEAARQIVNYCGRLPLALRVAAATLGMRSWQGKRSAAYAQQLANERQRLDRLKLENLDIRASFELSYQELDTHAAHLLGWLGLLPADFGTAILEPLTEEPPETVQQALALLVDGRLVDPSDPAAGERYVLHDLMRLFALEKLDAQAAPEAVQAAKGRLVQWCGNQSNTWGNALNPVQRRQWAEALIAEWASQEDGTASPSATDLEPWLLQTALNWFEAERPTLMQMFGWAIDTQQGQTSVALAADLAPFFSLRGYWDDWVNSHQQALTAARQAGDQRGEGLSLNNLGLVYKSQGKWSDAIECYQQALQIQRTIGDVHGEGQSLGNLGNVYQSQGQWSDAIECYQQSLQIQRALGDVHGEGQSLNNLGGVYQSQGQWSDAIDCYQQDLQICRAIGDVHGEGASLGNLGIVYQSQGKWSEAIECYQQSLQIQRTIGDVKGEGLSIMNLGIVYQSQGKWSEAIECFEQSLQTFRALGDVYGEGKSLNNLGNVHQSQGKWSEAIDCYQQSLQIQRAIGDVHGEGLSLANLGLVYEGQKQLEQATALWREALTKLHPDSPDHATVTQWLQTATQPSPDSAETFSQPRRPAWLGWLLPLGILLFLGWNLVKGYWLIALLGVLALVIWQWQRRRH